MSFAQDLESTIPQRWTEVVRAIHASPSQVVISVTGGGSQAIAALLSEPGASRTVLEARVPYSQTALVEWLGGKPDQACSAATARAMAMAGWRRACELAPDLDPRLLLGVGCTASLASDRPKRGAHRVHVALQSLEWTETFSLTLAKDEDGRQSEERHAASLILALLGKHCGVDVAGLLATLPSELNLAQLAVDSACADSAVSELALGSLGQALVPAGEIAALASPPALPKPLALFPGAFNPVHRGHLRMAQLAEQRTGLPLVWELSLANVDKPLLDYLALRERVSALRETDARPLLLTTAPTFRQKAELQPGCVFVVGVDTIERIADCKYYRNAAARGEAFAAIASAGCRFLVFGRAVAGGFRVLSDLALPPALETLCDEVSAEEFREDVSSSELRGEPT